MRNRIVSMCSVFVAMAAMVAASVVPVANAQLASCKWTCTNIADDFRWVDQGSTSWWYEGVNNPSVINVEAYSPAPYQYFPSGNSVSGEWSVYTAGTKPCTGDERDDEGIHVGARSSGFYDAALLSGKDDCSVSGGGGGPSQV